MKTATKKTPAKKKFINEADIKGPMMVFTGSRTKEDLQFMAEWFATRKAAREAAVQKKQPKTIIQ